MTLQTGDFGPPCYDDFAAYRKNPTIPGSWLAIGLALSGALVAAMMIRAGLVIAPRNSGFAMVSLTLLGLAALRAWLRTPASLRQQQVRDFAEDALLFCSISLLGVIASYPVAANSSGFVDPALEHVDRILHFNWLFWYREVSASPSLQYAGTIAYAGIFVSPFVILGCLAREGRRLEARLSLLTFWFAAVLTLLLFWRFPAQGPLAFLWHGRIPYMPTSALYQEQLIQALRLRLITDVNLGALRGLVCAPSFHTVSAVLYMVAAWPIVRLRWPMIALNGVMLLATPIEGTHYLADMLAGVLVAVFAVAAVRIAVSLWFSRGEGEGEGDLGLRSL